MKPYYRDDYVTLYHGDCREIVPYLIQNVRKFDLLLTDPPYGIGRSGMKKSTSKHGGRKAYFDLGWDNETPCSDTFKMLFSASKSQVIWGANYFTKQLPPSMGWLVWDKGQDIASSDCELAFSSRNAALRRKTLNRCELAKDGAEHPTQKPIELIRWCISFFPESNTILDPFAGSGTTGRAAKDLRKQCTPIEREEKYCEIAARRMQQEVLPL